MSAGALPNVLSIPPGVPFLPAMADALLGGRLVRAFRDSGDPLALADVTIYVPTRRAARSLRTIFAERASQRSAILPLIRPLGEFDDDEAAFDPEAAAALDLPPPIASVDRLLSLATLVRAWKRRLPGHLAQRFEEEMVVPASAADAVWLARDLAALLDEIETEGSDWSRLGGLAPGALAGWWQITLDFLSIVTEHWPQVLATRGQSNPAAHRSALIRLEAARLKRNPPAGPVIAAGSTGSIPATAELLSVIARLPCGAVVLPGLDKDPDERSWEALAHPAAKPPLLGHPQFGLVKLLRTIGIPRAEVEEIAVPDPAMQARAAIVAQALRPAEATDDWTAERASLSADGMAAALAGVTLVEAPRERDEALAAAIALKQAALAGESAALVTGDRDLARRVAAELARFGVRADDSGGTALSVTAPGTLLRLLVQSVFEPGDPVPVVALLKHPLLLLGFERSVVRAAAETIELIALRGGTGRPDVVSLDELFETRLTAIAGATREPIWFKRLSVRHVDQARKLLAALGAALKPLAALRYEPMLDLAEITRATVAALEALGRDESGQVAGIYAGDAGAKLAEVLRGLASTNEAFDFLPKEWPDVLAALLATETVKPAPGSERRIAIWGALEARLQSVDTLVVGGLNEGTWPRRADADRFMSRLMKSGLDLEPPERRIGQAAHDFVMAMGARKVVLTRAARAGETPAVASRWLQRLLTFAGKEQAQAMRSRGDVLLGWARGLDEGLKDSFAPRPNPKPPLAVRPDHFSVTEIETLRRDPYAIYARRILKLSPLDPLLRDPSAAERGTLFHQILHRFSMTGIDPRDPAAHALLLEKGRECFSEAALPRDVEAVWWPRFAHLASGILAWDASRAAAVRTRHAEARAERTVVGATGVTLSGYADRVDLLPAGMADILDYKTGSSPSKAQAHTLLSPQLALEGALLARGAFRDLGKLEPADLAFVRLKANGEVLHESILTHNNRPRSASDLSDHAWGRLERLLAHYADPNTGYLSRAVPFRESEVDGDYDHLARVLEWSAGGDGPDAEGGGE